MQASLNAVGPFLYSSRYHCPPTPCKPCGNELADDLALEESPTMIANSRRFKLGPKDHLVKTWNMYCTGTAKIQ
jgi:hypothetical protein